MNTWQRSTLILMLGIGLGAMGILLLRSMSNEDQAKQVKDAPLYWVAPMDSSYRRDQPGKSPMGMDLVPVYQEPETQNNDGNGVRISADVEHNLGVRTAKVQEQVLQSDIVTVGYVQYDQDRLIHIHPRVEGWVERLYIKASGDPVQKGEPLYALYSPYLVNVQEEYLLALKMKNERLREASEERLKALNISEQFIKSLRESNHVKQTITYYSAQNGVVDNLNIREGFYVQPGTNIMSVGNLDEVWVEAEVFERQAAWVKSGLPVTMTLDYLPGKQWQGVLDYVYPTLDEKTRTLRVRIKFKNTDMLLKPNMFAQVIIHARGDELALTVPREAVIRTGMEDRVVLGLGDGLYQAIPVVVGPISGDVAQILSGVKLGDTVVTSAQFLLDSESSKRAGFARMHHIKPNASAVWVNGLIERIDLTQRRIQLNHEPIEQWHWPSMSMNFNVAESLDLRSFNVGDKRNVKIVELENGQYEIEKIKPVELIVPELTEDNSARVSGEIITINEAARIVTIHRQPIKKWGRAAATIDFHLAPDVNLTLLKTIKSLNFTFYTADGIFVIQRIHTLDGKPVKKLKTEAPE